jgi:hypothetical protein
MKIKYHFKIFFIMATVTCGLSTDCKADTVDNYQIYIGKTLKLTETSFNPLSSTIPLLKLDSSIFFETININFNHCTHGASDRQLKLTDTANKTIMIWKFGDKEQKPLMGIPINEILTNPAISSNSSFNLYYVDKEYPVWQLLTYVSVGQINTDKKELKGSTERFDTKLLLIGFSILTILFLIFKLVLPRSPNR